MTNSVSNPIFSQQPLLAVVLPCYNEEAVLGDTIQKLCQLLQQHIDGHIIDGRSFLLFVDDGSRDKTLSILRSQKSPMVKTLKLSANCGHQSALLAGMHYVTGKVDCMVSMDADLQDDTASLLAMIEQYKLGHHIVFGVRDNRDSDTAYKRRTAQWFYSIMKYLGVNLVYNHADYRLLSNTVLVEFGRYREVNLFLRGIFPKMGFTNAIVYYKRMERLAGETKYSFKKMLALAFNGITSFSNVPLKLISYIGFFVFFGSLLSSLWILFVYFTGRNVPGWVSTTLPIYFIGGIQLLALGVIGEYISKIYLETKQRPAYHIEEVIE